MLAQIIGTPACQCGYCLITLPHDIIQHIPIKMYKARGVISMLLKQGNAIRPEFLNEMYTFIAMLYQERNNILTVFAY